MIQRALPWLAALSIAGIAGFAAPQLIDQTSPSIAIANPLVTESGQSIADVTERVLPSVVSLAVKSQATPAADRDMGGMFPFGLNPRDFHQGPRQGIGSGVIVSVDGYILTNNHVVDGADEIRVKLADGRETTAKVVGTDPKSDLAVVRIEKKISGLKPLPVGSSSSVRLGEVVLAVGNPMGVGQSVTMGIVSAKGRANMGIVDYEDFIQTDAAINPGNSGGALVNMKGELIGINTAILSRSGGNQGIGFAIPSDMAQPIMHMLIKDGRVNRGYLGVIIQQVDNDLAKALGLGVERGVLISSVMDGSPAGRAGVRRDDVVVGINGQRVTDQNVFRNRIAAFGAGQKVTLEVMRDGARKNLEVKLGKLPEDSGVASTDEASPSGSKTHFGVRVAPLDGRARSSYDIPASVKHGVVVTDVQRGSKAASLGLQPGDVLMEVNRTAIDSADALRKAYDKAGSKLAILVYRDGMTRYIVVDK